MTNNYLILVKKMIKIGALVVALFTTIDANNLKDNQLMNLSGGSITFGQ